MKKTSPRRTTLRRLTALVRAGSVTPETLRGLQGAKLIVNLHRFVLRLHFGWQDGTPWTLAEIAQGIRARSPFRVPLLTTAMVERLLDLSAARILTELDRS